MLGDGFKAIFTFFGTQGERNTTQEQTHEEEERKQQQKNPSNDQKKPHHKQTKPHHNPQLISFTQTLSGTESKWQFQRDKVIIPMKGKALKSSSEE